MPRKDSGCSLPRLTQRARALPGVEKAAVAYQHPMRPGWTNSFEIEGKPRSQGFSARLRDPV